MMETKEQKNESRTKEKKPLTEQQRQQRQKMLVYPLMVLLFAGCMWLIFAPSSEDKEKERQGQGFNTDMPMPEDSKIIGDKAKATSSRIWKTSGRNAGAWWATSPRSGTTATVTRQRTMPTLRTITA